MPVGARIDVLTLCSRALRSSRIDVTRRATDGPGGPASAASAPVTKARAAASCRPKASTAAGAAASAARKSVSYTHLRAHET